MLASTFYLIIGGISGGLLTVGAGAIIITALTKKKREAKKLLAKYLPSKAADLPESVAEELEGLREALQRLLALQEFKTATALASVIELTQEIFMKLKSRDGVVQSGAAAASYSHMLSKLNRALSSYYFFDMLERPEFWNNVEERKAVVRAAVKAVNSELLKAVKDFNSYSDYSVTVDLEAILDRGSAESLLKDIS